MKNSDTRSKGKTRNSSSGGSKEGGASSSAGDGNKKLKSGDKKREALTEKDLTLLPDEFKPLSCFIDEPEKLIGHLFATVRTSDLTRMIPKCLKTYDVEELKEMCLTQLKRLPKNLIISVLDGGDLSSSIKEEGSVASKQEGETKSTDPDSKEIRVLKRKLSSEKEASPERDMKRFTSETEQQNAPKSEPPSSEMLLELYPSNKEVETMADRRESSSPLAVKEGSDFELLELEMRARAIRSLLRSRGLPSSDEE